MISRVCSKRASTIGAEFLLLPRISSIPKRPGRRSHACNPKRSLAGSFCVNAWQSIRSSSAAANFSLLASAITSNYWPFPMDTQAPLRVAKSKRDFSLRRPTLSQERKRKKKSARSVRNDGQGARPRGVRRGGLGRSLAQSAIPASLPRASDSLMPIVKKMKITALAGGVGASKLLLGLYEVMDPTLLTIIVNTGDDIVLHGLRISPDLDIVTYTLAGVVDFAKGWSLPGKTFHPLNHLPPSAPS